MLSFWTEWANSLLCCARFHIIMAKNITLFIYLLAPGLALQISKLSKWSYWNKDFFELLHLLEFTLNSVRFRQYIYIFQCSLHSVGLAPFATKVTWIWKETSASLQVIRWSETQQTPSGAAMNYLPSGNCKNQNYIKSNKKKYWSTMVKSDSLPGKLTGRLPFLMHHTSRALWVRAKRQEASENATE